MNPASFSLTDNKLLPVLETTCAVSQPYNSVFNTEHPPVFDVKGIWDTGASASVISRRMITSMALKPFSKCTMFYAQGNLLVNIYKINIILPNGVEISNVTVSEGNLLDTDILIGMDIINLGDFAITHRNSGTLFSFQIPSTHHIDFGNFDSF